jgi:hypothetical protein
MAKSKQEKFKLDGIHKEYVINKLALYCGVTEIAESLKIEFDIDITPQGISHYKSEWEDEWKKRREFFNKHLIEIEPYANKAVRVKKLGDLIRDLDGDWWVENIAIKKNQIAYNKDGSPVKLKTNSNHLIVGKLLELIQHETEPRKVAHTNESGDGPAVINVTLTD